MTHDEAIHFAECLKHNYTINFADMEDFCNMVIEALEQQPCEDAVSRSDVIALIERINLKYSSSFITGISQTAFKDLLYETLSLPSVTPKGVTVTDFADKCRECGREKVLDKIRAEIAIPTDSSTIKDYDEGWEDAIKRDLQIIDKYKAESEDKE